MTLEQHHVGPASVGEVVGDGAADHAPTDDDDAGTLGELGPGKGGYEEHAASEAVRASAAEQRRS